jgi:hypothetical protein
VRRAAVGMQRGSASRGEIERMSSVTPS